MSLLCSLELFFPRRKNDLVLPFLIGASHTFPFPELRLLAGAPRVQLQRILGGSTSPKLVNRYPAMVIRCRVRCLYHIQVQ